MVRSSVAIVLGPIVTFIGVSVFIGKAFQVSNCWCFLSCGLPLGLFLFRLRQFRPLIEVVVVVVPPLTPALFLFSPALLFLLFSPAPLFFFVSLALLFFPHAGP